MFTNGTSGLSPSDVLALSNNDGAFGGNGSWVWLIIILLLFGGWNNGWGNNGSGAMDNYVLNSDFSSLSRQIADGFSEQRGQGIQIANGISSLGYDQLARIDSLNQNITNAIQQDTIANMQNTNALSSQLASCCCQNRYDALANNNALQTAISSGFCTTNFNAQSNTRDIVDSQNAGTQAILAKLSQMETNAKDEKIAELTAMNSDLRFQASQVAQNNFIQNLVKPPINPCYVTQNPYCSCGNAYYYGTTIA